MNRPEPTRDLIRERARVYMQQYMRKYRLKAAQKLEMLTNENIRLKTTIDEQRNSVLL